MKTVGGEVAKKYKSAARFFQAGSRFGGGSNTLFQVVHFAGVVKCVAFAPSLPPFLLLFLFLPPSLLSLLLTPSLPRSLSFPFLFLFLFLSLCLPLSLSISLSLSPGTTQPGSLRRTQTSCTTTSSRRSLLAATPSRVRSTSQRKPPRSAARRAAPRATPASRFTPRWGRSVKRGRRRRRSSSGGSERRRGARRRRRGRSARSSRASHLRSRRPTSTSCAASSRTTTRQRTTAASARAADRVSCASFSLAASSRPSRFGDKAIRRAPSSLPCGSPSPAATGTTSPASRPTPRRSVLLRIFCCLYSSFISFPLLLFVYPLHISFVYPSLPAPPPAPLVSRSRRATAAPPCSARRCTAEILR